MGPFISCEVNKVLWVGPQRSYVLRSILFLTLPIPGSVAYPKRFKTMRRFQVEDDDGEQTDDGDWSLVKEM